MTTIGPAKTRGAGGRPAIDTPSRYIRVSYRRQYRRVGKVGAVRMHVSAELKVGAPWLRAIGARISDTLVVTVAKGTKGSFLVISKLPDPSAPTD